MLETAVRVRRSELTSEPRSHGGEDHGDVQRGLLGPVHANMSMTIVDVALAHGYDLRCAGRVIVLVEKLPCPAGR